jgi:hypothetical protein
MVKVCDEFLRGASNSDLVARRGTMLHLQRKIFYALSQFSRLCGNALCLGG